MQHVVGRCSAEDISRRGSITGGNCRWKLSSRSRYAVKLHCTCARLKCSFSTTRPRATFRSLECFPWHSCPLQCRSCDHLPSTYYLSLGTRCSSGGSFLQTILASRPFDGSAWKRRMAIMLKCAVSQWHVDRRGCVKRKGNMMMFIMIVTPHWDYTFQLYDNCCKLFGIT